MMLSVVRDKKLMSLNRKIICFKIILKNSHTSGNFCPQKITVLKTDHYFSQ